MHHLESNPTQKHGHPGSPQSDRASGELRLVAWETTRNCNLSCVHCRASANMGPFSGELDTAAAFRLLDEIVCLGNPIIILTGGEPLLSPFSGLISLISYPTEPA
jgi:AdoMet-dependent heme synthase